MFGQNVAEFFKKWPKNKQQQCLLKSDVLQKDPKSSQIFGLLLSEHLLIETFYKLPNPWSTLVEGGKERYQPLGKLTLELVLANQKQNKILCLWTMQLTKWAGKVPYLLLLKCSMPNLVPLNRGGSGIEGSN